MTKKILTVALLVVANACAAKESRPSGDFDDETAARQALAVEGDDPEVRSAPAVAPFQDGAPWVCRELKWKLDEAWLDACTLVPGQSEWKGLCSDEPNPNYLAMRPCKVPGKIHAFIRAEPGKTLSGVIAHENADDCHRIKLDDWEQGGGAPDDQPCRELTREYVDANRREIERVAEGLRRTWP